MLIFDQNDLRVKRQTAHIQIGQANRYYSEYSAIIHFVFSYSPATTREFRVRSLVHSESAANRPALTSPPLTALLKWERSNL